MTKILLVEPQPLTRMGIALTLEVEPGITVVGQVGSAEEAIDQFEELNPDLIIVDNHLLGMCGLNLILQLKARKPDLLFIVISPHEEAICAERALRAGGQGYITKSDGPEVLKKAVQMVLAGDYFISTKVASDLFRAVARSETPIIKSAIDVLSERELEVFELLSQGLSTQEIAEKVDLSARTVESYFTRAAAKLHAEDTAALKRQAVIWANSQRVCHSWKGCFTRETA